MEQNKYCSQCYQKIEFGRGKNKGIFEAGNIRFCVPCAKIFIPALAELLKARKGGQNVAK